MARHSKKLREEARRLYLTWEVTSVSEIARRLKVKPHTVGGWKKDEDWDALRLRIDRQAAERLVEKIASDRVTLNAQHFRMWGLVIQQTLELMQRTKNPDIQHLERCAVAFEKSQKGQRLARGLSLDGETEEAIRAEAAAESRALIDTFIDVVKQKVPDEAVRDEISRALIERVPKDAEQDMQA